MFGIPDEKTLKGRNEEFSGSQHPDEFHNIFVCNAYVAIAVIQVAFSIHTSNFHLLNLYGFLSGGQEHIVKFGGGIFYPARRWIATDLSFMASLQSFDLQPIVKTGFPALFTPKAPAVPGILSVLKAAHIVNS